MYILQVRNMIKRLCYDNGDIKLEASCFTYYEDCRLKCCTGGYDFTAFMMRFASEQAVYNQFVNSISNYKFILFTNKVYNQTFSCPAVNISMKNIIDNLMNDYPLNVGVSDSCQINLNEPYIPIETLVGTQITCTIGDYLNNIVVPAEGTYWAIKGISRNPTTGIYGADVCRQNELGNNIECINSIGDDVRIYSSGYMFQVLAVGNFGTPEGYATLTVAKPIDLCEVVVCNNICIGYDLYSQKCVNGACVTDQLIEQNSAEYCNYIPPCISNWVCEVDLDGLNTGWKIDGCGNTLLDVIKCPVGEKPPEEPSNVLFYGIAAGIIAIGLGLLSKIKKVK